MKSILSTQNLQTFFLRKYWRLPLGRPPGPPGPPEPPPPGPPSRRGPPCPPPWPPSRRGAPPGAGACFCSSAIPSTLSLIAPALPRTNFCEPVTRSHFAQNKKTSRRAELARRRGLLRSCRSSRRCRRAPRTPCRALVALQRKCLLAFQIFSIRAKRKNSFYSSSASSDSAGFRRLYLVIAASSPWLRIISTASPASPIISAATSSSALFIGRSTYSLRLLSG